MQFGAVVMPPAGGMSPLATVVMPLARGMRHAARGMMYAAVLVMRTGSEVTHVAPVVVHEGMAVSWVPAGVVVIPSAVLQLARRAFYVVAGVGHGLGRMGPMSAAPMGVSTSAGPRRMRPCGRRRVAPDFNPGLRRPPPFHPLRGQAPSPSRAPSGAMARSGARHAGDEGR